MHENVQLRVAVNVLGCFHGILAIFSAYFCLFITASLMGSLWAALIYFGANLILLPVEIWICDGLICATHMNLDNSEARILAKRYIIWSPVLQFVESMLFVLCWPNVHAGLGTSLPAAFRLIFCYFVRRFIQSLRKTSVVTEKV